jgi:ABC-2 type transport system ATP-binding protein
MTTHELAEAERMADRMVVVRSGRVLAQGTAAQLGELGGAPVVRFTSRPGLDTEGLGQLLGAAVAEESRSSYRVDTTPTPAVTAAIATWLAERNAELIELRTTASLEETYLSLVGGEPDGAGDEFPSRRERRRT